jgi:DNA-binding NarL/FixJ family response regulator
MDIRMPELDGISTAPDGPRVLILTTFDLDEYVCDALVAGASGFLLKDVGPEQLPAAIRVVANGEGLLAPSVTSDIAPALRSASSGSPGSGGGPGDLAACLDRRCW